MLGKLPILQHASTFQGEYHKNLCQQVNCDIAQFVLMLLQCQKMQLMTTKAQRDLT